LLYTHVEPLVGGEFKMRIFHSILTTTSDSFDKVVVIIPSQLFHVPDKLGKDTSRIGQNGWTSLIIHDQQSGKFEYEFAFKSPE